MSEKRKAVARRKHEDDPLEGVEHKGQNREAEKEYSEAEVVPVEITGDSLAVMEENAEKIKEELPGQPSLLGWEPPELIPEETEARQLVVIYDAAVQMAERRTYTNLWQLADVLLYLEDAYGQEFWDFVPDTEFAAKTYRNAMRIGYAFSDKERRWDPEEVSFWLHGDVAADWIEDYEADELLEQYATGELNRQEFRAEIKKLKAEKANGKAQQEEMDLGTDDWPTCPLCTGSGKVSPDAKKAYFDEERRGA